MRREWDGRAQPGAPLRVVLGLVVLAWGIQAIVTQSLLLREAMVLMFGNEFAWGVVLFAWLFGVACGGLLGPSLGARLASVDLALAAVLLVLSGAACVELWVFRGARGWLGVEPGELLPLPTTALAAMVFISPVGALVGLAFPLACRIAGDPNSDQRPMRRPAATTGAGPLGRVYAFESAGSLIGGAAFSFWAVEHLAPIETALLCAGITTVASGGLLAVTRRPLIGGGCLVGLGAAAWLAALLFGDTLNDRLVERRWRNVAPGYQLCAEAESKYQNLVVGRRAEQFTLYCDGQIAGSFPDPYTFVPLAHFWLCQHPHPRRVLVLGGGAEGLLAEILRHPVEHIDYVETDPRQIELIDPYLAEVDRRALADPRVTVHHMDARYFVKTQAGRFDLVIARLPEPTSALRARFYTDEFYGELRRAMRPESVLCMTAAAAPGELSAVSGEYLASIRSTLRRHFPHLVIGWGNPAHVLAATRSGLVSIDPPELAQRYRRRGVESALFDPAWFDGATDWLEPGKVARRAAELEAVGDAEVSTDLRPCVYMQRLVLWDRMTGASGGGGRMIERLRSVRWFEVVAALVAVGGVTFALCCLRERWRKKQTPADCHPWVSSGAIVLSVATTGFATMALSIIWLFSFQNLYGYVYQRIGWIIAVFMGGLVIGCAVIDRRSRHAARAGGLSAYLWRRLVAVDVLLALLALMIPLVLPALGAAQSTRLTFMLVEWAISVLVALTGVLGGAAFALAGGLQLARIGEVGASAGSVVGADHAGACAGALLTGVLLVPVFGTAAAALLLVGMKLASATLLLVGWRTSHTRKGAGASPQPG